MLYGFAFQISLCRVDQGSIAERCGLKFGDQILDANGVSFEQVLHNDAVEYLKSHKHIILTVKVSSKLHLL